MQTSVGWSERGAATSSVLFMRSRQALGPGIAGAILNFSLTRTVPSAGETLNQLPARRASLDPQTIDRLSHAIAGALHQVYVIDRRRARRTRARARRPAAGGREPDPT